MQNVKLRELNRLAALNASRALFKLCGRPVDVRTLSVEVQKLQALAPPIAPEEIAAGIYLPVTGHVTGAVLLIFPKETAFTVCDLLLRRQPGTTRQLSELDKSALKEMGNIVSGNYLAVLSNALHVKIIEHVPNFSLDMFGAILSQIISTFARDAEEALVVEVEFIFKPMKLNGYLLLLFKSEEIDALVKQGTQKGR